jgi:hypothetical protein
MMAKIQVSCDIAFARYSYTVAVADQDLASLGNADAVRVQAAVSRAAGHECRAAVETPGLLMTQL